MNQIIAFVLAAFALVASVQAYAYGGHGSSYGNVQSYSLGANNAGYGSHSRGYGREIAAIQPLLSQEIYPGRNSYRAYHSAPSYSNIVLPVVPSAPLAKLYANNYGSSHGSSY